MATFSVNQSRNLYVANALKSPSVLESDNVGSIAVKADTNKEHLYFQYKGAGGMTRSDLINIKDIMSIKATGAKDMAREPKTVTVTLDSKINSGNPVSGQDYILRIAFKQVFGMSDEDQYFKYGAVHAYNSMTTSDFYKTLALSLAKNFSREAAPLVNITLTEGESTAVPVTGATTEASLTGTYKAVVIKEAPQDWVLGTKSQTPVYFEVIPTTITFEGDDVVWGKVEDTKSTDTIGNGKTIADMEYFYMGERGDIYRGIGFPNVIPTKYLVDPEKEYNTIDIHYAYEGSNESVQKSEKDITIVVPKEGGSNTLTNNIITAIVTATGLNVKTLDNVNAHDA